MSDGSDINNGIRSVIRIAVLRYAPYSLPFAQPFRTAHGTLSARRGWLLCVEDEAGAWGMGEAAPLAGFGMESHEQAGAALADWSRALPGREIDLEIAALNAALVTDSARGVESAAGAKSAGGTDSAAGAESAAGPGPAFGLAASHASCPAAAHALELALLDLAARRAGLPLARYLSAGAATEVACNALLSADPPKIAVQNALALVALGFETLKIKVGVENPREELERLRAIRQAVGGAVKLRIDANGSWTESQALPLLEKLGELQIEYVEQPLPREALEGMARLAAASPIPVAADEAVLSLQDARLVLEKRAAQVLVLKPMALGGVLTALQVARLAARVGVRAVITTMLEGAYGRAGAAHAAAALSTIPGIAPYAHGLATGGLLAEDLTASPLKPEQGRIKLPQAEGLGLERPATLAGPGK